ncbi:unnamed protein product [Malus baccata var. baccata]
MAYGGGRFAISYHLAVELVKILDGRINQNDQFYNPDVWIQAYLGEIGMPQTKESGFHQFDTKLGCLLCVLSQTPPPLSIKISMY